DGADSRDRSAAGTAKRARPDSFGKIMERDFSSDRETRADNSISQSARIFHLVALQQMREGARLSELQRRAHLSSLDVTAELSPLWAHRRCSKEMSGMRAGRVDLRRLWNRKGGINRRANFSERSGKTNGRRFDVA